MPPDLQPILTSLTTSSLPIPSTPWLHALLATKTPPPPLPSLLATVRARLLASDLTTPNLLDPVYITSHSLPPDLCLPSTKSAVLPRDIVFQVLDIDNLSKSRWSQVEELEAIARGEGTKGREIVRLPTTAGNEGDGGGADNAGERGVTQATQTQQQPPTQARQQVPAAGQSGERDTHRLLLQDCKGTKVSALELRKVDKIGIGRLSIGEKLLVKAGGKVSRGVVMLEPGTCAVLGGKVEVWHRAWVEGRLGRLKEAAAEGAAGTAVGGGGGGGGRGGGQGGR